MPTETKTKATKGRGRPARSVVRDRLEEIMDATGSMYGYRLSKIYSAAFEPIAARTIYYHLHKGVALGVFLESKTEQATGSYTWGRMAERRHYVLGPGATHTASEHVRAIVKQQNEKV